MKHWSGDHSLCLHAHDIPVYDDSVPKEERITPCPYWAGVDSGTPWVCSKYTQLDPESDDYAWLEEVRDYLDSVVVYVRQWGVDD